MSCPLGKPNLIFDCWEAKKIWGLLSYSWITVQQINLMLLQILLMFTFSLCIPSPEFVEFCGKISGKRSYYYVNLISRYHSSVATNKIVFPVILKSWYQEASLSANGDFYAVSWEMCHVYLALYDHPSIRLPCHVIDHPPVPSLLSLIDAMLMQGRNPWIGPIHH